MSFIDNNNDNDGIDAIENNNNNLNTTYKYSKEQFVYGLEGVTNPYEIVVIFCTSFSCIVLYYYYLYSNSRNRISSSSSSSLPIYCYYIYEFILVIIPMIVCQTIWFDPYGITILVVELLITSYIVLRYIHSSYQQNARCSKLVHNDLTLSIPTGNIKIKIVEFIPVHTLNDANNNTAIDINRSIQTTTMSIYRSSILLYTVIAILGIDFNMYPRQYGKTEISGYSIMDLGAASFIVMAGMIATTTTAAAATQNKVQQFNLNYRVVLYKQIRRIVPLLIMGTIRLVTHKGIDYPEHHSEYGIHWNFFYTLLVVLPISSMISIFIFHKQPNWVIPTIVLVLYQYVLSYHHLHHFIVSAPRICPIQQHTTIITVWYKVLCNVWYANREGIVGCISYTALFLISEYISYTYFWNTPIQRVSSKTRTTSSTIHIWQSTKRLWYTVILLYVLWQLSTSSFFHTSFTMNDTLVVSRRTTNTLFCIWVMFINIFQFTSIYTLVLLVNNILSKYHTPPPPAQQQQAERSNNEENYEDTMMLLIHPPLIMASINRNGFYIFVISNLLTGIINLSINTLTVPNHKAFGILLVYVGIVACISILLDYVRSKLSSTKQQYIDPVKSKQE